MFTPSLTNRKEPIKNLLKVMLVALVLFAVSCKKDPGISNTTTTTPGGTTTPTDSLIAPLNFDFNTNRLVTINVNLASNSNEPIAGVPVNIYTGDPNSTEPIFTALSDDQGLLQAQINVASSVDTLIIDPKYIGLMRNAKAVIINNAVNATIGGPNGYSGSIVQNNEVGATLNRMHGLNSYYPMAAATNASYKYVTNYDGDGVPNNILSPLDKVPASLLLYLNTSLPETVDVRKLHPQYLTSTATADVNIVKASDVWVTFLYEGAGYRDAVGYYTYPTNNPPKSAADITNVNIIYENASLPGSGGNLKSGSRIKLGTFQPGTSIGYVLFSNGWTGSKVNTDIEKFYSTTACNPETDPNLKRHTVLLNSSDLNLYLVGFEDLNRSSGSCDNDFNDVVLYTTSNPIDAISNNNVQPVDQAKDSDGDGVIDNLDAFPNDPTRAYVSYYPSKTTFGTLAFEDLWPSTGDYDLNDLVVGYRYKTVTNAKNLAVEVYADYVVQAAGASYVSGFGVQLPFSPSQVKTVTGQKLVGGYIKQNANGTEASQAKAVIIPFDNYTALIKRPGGYYINTQIGAPYVKSDTAHIYMSFTSPISASTLGNAPFNPFLISNQRRGYEIHLPNNLPTDLADKTLFGKNQDNSNPATGRYYVSNKQWPFALNISGPFNYPTEGTNISKSYYKFLEWAKSGGKSYPDWYNNSYSWYFNSTLIYTH